METMDAIRGRRAVRDYMPDPVATSTLYQLISAASWAPSAMNEQPWQFTVVTDGNLLDKISIDAKAWMLRSVAVLPRSEHFRDVLSDPHFHIFHHAPALIVISAQTENRWCVEDCALAAQNLMLAAHDCGLGSCWIGFAQDWLNTREQLDILGLAANSRVVAPVVVGHPKSSIPPTTRKNPVIRWIGTMPVDTPAAVTSPSTHKPLRHP